MPLRDSHQIVSVDDHLVEHPRVWLDRLPSKFDGRTPRIEEQGGKHVWVYDGVVFPTIGLNARRRARAAGLGGGPHAFRGDDPRLLRPGGAAEGHGRRRRPRRPVFPVVPRLRRRGVPPGAGQGAGARLHPGLERLHGRRVVRRRARPLHPTGAAAGVGRRGLRRRGRADGGQGRAHGVLPGQPRPAGPALTTGNRCGTSARRPTSRSRCTSGPGPSCPGSPSRRPSPSPAGWPRRTRRSRWRSPRSPPT